MIPEEFHFIRPEWLFLFIPLVILFGFIWHGRLNKSNWQSVCDIQLLPYLLVDKPTKRNRWPLFWLALGGILAVFALAGPAWERLPSPVFRNDSALVIVLDLSASMDAQDIKPSRLDRSKFKIRDILDRRKDGQTALVVYAGEAYTVTPLTNDTETIGNHLSALSTSLMPSSGSNTGKGLIQAGELLEQAGLRSGHILLISDGVNPTNTFDAVEQLEVQSYLVSVIGVGTPDGAPIPRGRGGFLKDSSGNIVIPRLKAKELRELASQGGGVFRVMSTDNRDIDTIEGIIDQGSMGREKQESDLRIDQWDEKGPWLLLLLLPIAAFAFRKGVVAVFVLTLCSPFQSLKALEWDDLWTTRDQRANRAFQSGEPKQAAQLFEDRKWKGAAAYRAGDFDQSVEALEGFEDHDSLYNKGNSLANLSRYQEALDAYKQVLESDPDHQDALYNKELVEEQLKKQQSQDSSGQNSDKQEGDQQDSQEGDKSESNNESAKTDSGQNQPDSSQQSESDTPNSDESKDGSERQENQDGQENNENQQDIEQQAEQMEQNQGPTRPNKADLSQSNTPDESAQANEQWLRRIPDDPGRLLREKFRYQYSRRNRGNNDETEAW